ncbi:hypothetical protein [Planctomycetes bacterium TBK1r]|uniref:Uncharacterized protein n=1 Tax=Stieleria magnilauensis TaxID=2527963 RepID=A0ABX5XLC0_9BACT|nr:hypothetical protein TBK1r_17150 [Planctomycetes bacterium TBK1r]
MMPERIVCTAGATFDWPTVDANRKGVEMGGVAMEDRIEPRFGRFWPESSHANGPTGGIDPDLSTFGWPLSC